MKFSSKIKITIIIMLTFILMLTVKAYAVSLSVGASKSTVSPGETFTVTITGNDATGRVNISVAGGTTSASSTWIENNTQSITVTAGSSGTVRISASGELSSNTGEDKNVSSSKTVNIAQPVAPSNNSSSNNSSSSSSSSSSNKTTTTKRDTTTKEEKSKDATLSALSFEQEGIILTPEFSKDALEYKIEIPNEITSLTAIATPTDSKATVAVTGNTDFQVGENTINIEVTAEDGTKQVYVVKVTRAKEKLALNKLVIKYEGENGNLVEIPLTPEFISNIYEYNLGDISYKIKELLIEANSNLEGATIEIKGNENLVEGENTITITLTMPAESATEGEENVAEPEVVTYTIKVNKEKEPTLWQKIKDWFKGIGGFVFNWYNNNQKPIVIGALAFCIIAMVGLSIYIILDAKKYKMILQKLGKVSELNNMQAIESINVGEKIQQEEQESNSNILEEISKEKENSISELSKVKNEQEEAKKTGKRFK